ncbi:hypothetical protein D0Z08_19540 [Nocardioides immobilis]|uniref:Uncharacterized protein n=1 Tax=Nocardioides immobilis TaxID=2049295 RepID=A0A417XYI6_9ACTN|nr:hypothetical protein [Nocardioides immobilis]RHW25422.1 hypothetical protein D0Z08_19540 [Nocardioides immobilis]
MGLYEVLRAMGDDNASAGTRRLDDELSQLVAMHGLPPQVPYDGPTDRAADGARTALDDAWRAQQQLSLVSQQLPGALAALDRAVKDRRIILVGFGVVLLVALLLVLGLVA